jgi:transposase
VDLYRKVRLACAEGMSQREAARHFNISRDSVAKMMEFSVLNRPGFTGGQNSRRIARYGTESKEDLEAVFT